MRLQAELEDFTERLLVISEFQPIAFSEQVHRTYVSLHNRGNRPRSIYQYFNMAPRLSGQNCNYLSFLCLSIPKRDLDTKKTTPNIEVCPESLGAMLEY